MCSLMNQMLPFRAIFVFTFLLYKVSTESLEGPYVCVNKEKTQTITLLPYQKAYQYRTYEFCFDPKESFRCPRNKIGYKIAYKNVTKIEVISKKICCQGFIQENFHCIPSPTSTDGSLHLDSHHGKGFIPVVVVIAILFIALLLSVAFYYRRKYKREKNRSIYSNITDITSEMGKNEFGNPLYDATAKLPSLDNLKDKLEGSSMQQDKVLNDYEELHWKKPEKN